MSCACQGRLGTMIAVAVGVAAATVGTVNMVRTGCPLGSCGHCGESCEVVTPAAVETPATGTNQVQMTDQEKAAEELKKEETRLKEAAQKEAGESTGG